MLRRCLDEGLIQSYLDGELSQDKSQEAEAHVASCAACAAALREAEGELSMFTTAFAPESQVTVPTERLRERVEAAIADLRYSQVQQAAPRTQARWNFKNWLSTLAASLSPTPARVAAFASIIAVVAFAVFFGVIISRRQATRHEQVAVSNAPHAPSVATVPSEPARTETRETQPAADDVRTPAPDSNNAGSVVIAKASLKRAPAPRIKRATPTTNGRDSNPKEMLLPGEENYLKSIASLSSVIKAGGDVSMSPALRADYERSLAVVDQAIAASRRNVLRNPKDRDASKFLISAYQSKVELLGAVVEQSQVATLGR